MTPMFVETQSTQGPESLAATQSAPAKGMIRATQVSLEFSQTQAEGAVHPKTVSVVIWKINVLGLRPRQD